MPDIQFFVHTLLFMFIFALFISFIDRGLQLFKKQQKQSTIYNKLKLWYANLLYKVKCTSDYHKPIIYRGKEARNLYRNLKIMFKDIK